MRSQRSDAKERERERDYGGLPADKAVRPEGIHHGCSTESRPPSQNQWLSVKSAYSLVVFKLIKPLARSESHMSKVFFLKILIIYDFSIRVEMAEAPPKKPIRIQRSARFDGTRFSSTREGRGLIAWACATRERSIMRAGFSPGVSVLQV